MCLQECRNSCHSVTKQRRFNISNQRCPQRALEGHCICCLQVHGKLWNPIWLAVPRRGGWLLSCTAWLAVRHCLQWRCLGSLAVALPTASLPRRLAVYFRPWFHEIDLSGERTYFGKCAVSAWNVFCL